jgi:hypothetical protein
MMARRVKLKGAPWRAIARRLSKVDSSLWKSSGDQYAIPWMPPT